MSRPFPNLIRSSSRQRVDSIIDNNVSSAQDIRPIRAKNIERKRSNQPREGIPLPLLTDTFSSSKEERRKEELKRARVICWRCFWSVRCRGRRRGDKNRKDDFRGEKWSGRWKEDNNIGSLRLRRWLINQGRRWENSLTCNLRTMYRPSFFLPFAFLPIAPFLSPRTSRAHELACARIFFTELHSPRLCTFGRSPRYRYSMQACGNRPTPNVNCCLNLWQPSALRLAALHRRSSPSSGTPSLLPFHPNNHAYSFRCFTNDPSKRAPRLTTFRRSCRDHLELAPCVRPAFLLSPFPFSHFSPKRLFFPQFPYMRGSFLEKEGRFSRERRRSIHDAFFPPEWTLVCGK